jgi:hypothetical protein
MTKSQEDCRIDWSAVATAAPAASMRNAIVRFVDGYRGRRETPVTRSQILRHFSATPTEFVNAALLELVATGRLVVSQRSLNSARRSNGSYVYEVPS